MEDHKNKNCWWIIFFLHDWVIKYIRILSLSFSTIFSRLLSKYDIILFDFALSTPCIRNTNMEVIHNPCISYSIYSPGPSKEKELFLNIHYSLFFFPTPRWVCSKRYHLKPTFLFFCTCHKQFDERRWNFWQKLVLFSSDTICMKFLT